MFGHQVGGRRIASPERIDQLLVIFGVGSPRIGGMAPEQHPGLGGECLVGLGEAGAAPPPGQLLMGAEGGGGRFLRRPPFPRLPCLYYGPCPPPPRKNRPVSPLGSRARRTDSVAEWPSKRGNPQSGISLPLSGRAGWGSAAAPATGRSATVTMVGL